jgi:predicted Fe-Mo cluster-binding NifX family protein
MKIAIPASTNDMNSYVDSRFGRAKGFIIYDTDNGMNTWIPNQVSVQSTQGAGIQSAKSIIDAGADIVIAGNVGPKAYSLLKTNGIDIYLCDVMPINKAIENFKAGTLQKAPDANVGGHW